VTVKFEIVCPCEADVGEIETMWGAETSPEVSVMYWGLVPAPKGDPEMLVRAPVAALTVYTEMLFVVLLGTKTNWPEGSMASGNPDPAKNGDPGMAVRAPVVPSTEYPKICAESTT